MRDRPAIRGEIIAAQLEDAGKGEPAHVIIRVDMMFDKSQPAPTLRMAMTDDDVRRYRVGQRVRMPLLPDAERAK